MTSHQQHLLSVLSDIISSLVKAVNGAFTVLLDNVAIEIQQERQRFANSLAEAKRLKSTINCYSGGIIRYVSRRYTDIRSHRKHAFSRCLVSKPRWRCKTEMQSSFR